jgi:hypothetical protein
MSFFSQSPNGETLGHDDLAQEIAMNGRNFALERLREEDMRSYMFLLMLEVSVWT